ncbi:MAG: preprotein translocase subunit SecA [Arenicella sp.]|jgi:preprotein translocase subunit SecA
MMGLVKKFFGTKQDRDIKNLIPYVERINAMEEKMKSLSDEELQAQTPKLKQLFTDGHELEDLLPEAFATVREASLRVLKMRPYDVQLMGAVVLHKGIIAEMKTGEGKTLTATMSMYLNALTGRGAHLVTVNDYLASRDAKEMGELYNWLGITVGVILENMDDDERKEAYRADITYGTNNEFAFDYLRDNMKFDLEDYVQRDFNYCIVDEVDSILIDEARTPLLISGPSEGNSDLYHSIDKIIPKLNAANHYTVEEKSHTAVLTDDGIVTVQNLLNITNLYDPENLAVLHHVSQALRAHTLFKHEVDYVVNDGQVIIVDEFTGRLKEGSRWSDGLHQAIEAKEGVEVKSENQTLASITFQNYFKMYEKLTGMTGTADTEAEEFAKIYQLEVIVVPTNLPLIRDDQPDQVFATKKAKYYAVSKLIKELHQKGQPVLVGTITIESSEILSGHLTKFGVPHEVLNAKQHQREAEIVGNAGQKGSVTIATNMAGRGTDIKLSEFTKKTGGLCILGTERHESRRIDNQLRGRSGRQGDPGMSRFFLSLEDDLMRIFGSDRIKKFMERMGMDEDEPIEHSMISNAIAKAQKKVEGHNFDIRKHLLDFDNVMNEQRKVIYQLRKDILNDQGNLDLIHEMVEDVSFSIEDMYKPSKRVPIAEWPWIEINKGFKNIFRINHDLNYHECADKFDGVLHTYIQDISKQNLIEQFSEYDDDQVKVSIREVLLSTFDQHWKDHLLSMDHLKEGINLRSYGQKDPLTEYKREAYDLYENMKIEIKKAIVNRVFTIRLYTEEEIDILKRKHQDELEKRLEDHKRSQDIQEAMTQPISRGRQKVGRNDVCPCGSGKKFKHCHGA